MFLCQVYVMGSDSMGAAVPRGSLVATWPADIAARRAAVAIVFRSPADRARTIARRVLGVSLSRGDMRP